MKILTREEEAAHYSATLKGGVAGGLIGLGVGGVVIAAANHRFATFRSLTIPMKAFLLTSSGTFCSIISADRASRKFEFNRDPQRLYRDEATTDMEAAKASESTMQKVKDWGRENRYPIVTASWVASMALALGLVGRNKYLTGTQKLVQARVYAQGLTLAVLIATAALEVGDANQGKGRWETVKILDPNDPEHKHMIEKRIHHEAYEGEDLWRDMVATEERKIEARKSAAKEEAAAHEKHSSHHESSNNSKQASEEEHSKTESSQDKKPVPQGPKQGSGKAAKDAILADAKASGKNQSHEETEEKERKNMERQAEKESAARDSAQGDVRVKGRGHVG